jgi:hypothetical protein
MEIIAQSSLKIVRMKKLLLISSLFFVSFCSSNDVFAQSDSVKVEYKQESIDSTSFFQRRKYKYLDIKLKDEKNLIKLGVDPAIIYTEMRFNIKPRITFEKKINPSWSLIVEDVMEYLYSNDPRMLNEDDSPVHICKESIFSNSFNIGTRYYYGMKKAIREKTSGNNLNGNYFELTINGFPTITHYNVDRFLEPNYPYVIMLLPEKRTEIYNYFSFRLSWGIQRRLSNFSFIDAKAFINYGDVVNSTYRTGPVSVGIDINIGFGYNIKSK